MTGAENNRTRRRRGTTTLVLLAAASAASLASAGPIQLRLPAPVAIGVRSALANSPLLRRAVAGSSSSSTRSGSGRGGERSRAARRPASIAVATDGGVALDDDDDSPDLIDLDRCGLGLVGATAPGEERRYDALPLDQQEEARAACRHAFTRSYSSADHRRAGNDVRLCRAAVATERGAVDAAAKQPTTTNTLAATAVVPSVAAGGAAFPPRRLHFWENMVCGAVSRSVAQTIMHPANTMKTILQSNRGSGGAAPMTIADLVHPSQFKTLFRGAGAQLVLSVPHGAVNFAVLEFVRRRMSLFLEEHEVGRRIDQEKFGPALDFLSSCVSTFTCSAVSTPQMMITDNIMAGTYPNLPAAVRGLASEKGIGGFYSGWWPGLAGKIPSYALTWTLFQQLKVAQLRILKRPPKDIENSIMGCLAAGTTVCIMIPMDTIKTRLVTQLNYPDLVPYKGIADAAVRIAKEEGMDAFYRGLAPRLISVVPMIGIQFGVYEFMKKVMLSRGAADGEMMMAPVKEGARKKYEERMKRIMRMEKKKNLEEVMMEVAADDEQPFPAPHFDEEKFKELEKKAEAEASTGRTRK